MLEDDTRIQLELYDNLAIDGIKLGATVLTYERELNTVFVDFPVDAQGRPRLHHRLPVFGHPARTGTVRRHRVPQGSRRQAVDQHRLRGRGLQHLVAEQGSVARRGRGDGDSRRGPERPHRCLQRQVRRQDRSRRRLHALGLARAVPDQQLQRLAQHRQLRALRRPARRSAARLLRPARQPRQGQGASSPRPSR